MKPFARAISGGIMGRMIDPQLKENADLWEAELSENGCLPALPFRPPTSS